MANSKNPHAYPRRFHDLIDQLADKGTFTPLTYPGLPHSTALGKRNYLSGFRNAWKAEIAKTSPELRPAAEERYALAKRISGRIEAEPPIPGSPPRYTFTLFPKGTDTSWDHPQEARIPLPKNTMPEEQGSLEVIRFQQDGIVSYWNRDPANMLDPSWHGLSTEEKISHIAQRHFDKFGVDIRPLGRVTPAAIEDIGI